MSDLGNKEIFANNLKYYMELNNKDRNDIARDLDLPYTTVTSWCNGEFYPRIDKIEKLAMYFGIEKSDLIEKRKENSSISNPEDEIQVAFSSGFAGLNEENKKLAMGIIAGLKAKQDLEGK